MSRMTIQDFATANAIYANAKVTFYTVLNGQKTSTLATIYKNQTGTDQAANPQTLDSMGKWKQPIYIEDAVIMVVTSAGNTPDHETGVVDIPANAAAASEAAAASSAADAAASVVAAQAILDEIETIVVPEGALFKTDFSSDGSILLANTANDPQPLVLTSSTMLGRLSIGQAAALTPTQIRQLLNVADGATNSEVNSTTVDAAGAVMNSDYDANSILAATSDNTPAVLTVPASTFVGRKASGNIAAMSAAEARAVLNVADGATANTGTLSNIVEDTTPQLGGNLDVNGKSIVSVSNGNIVITPNGSGKIVLDGLSWPTADGSANQVLKTDGAGNISFTSPSGGGSGTSDLFFANIFEASDITGSSDMTSELETALNNAAGAPLYVPAGRYLFNNASGMSVTESVHLILSPDAVFVFDYATDNRCLWFRNDSDDTLDDDILSMSTITYFHGEKVTRVELADVSSWATNNICHIHSQDGWLLTESTSRRIGQSAKVAYVDTVNNYLYLYQRLDLVDLMTTSPRIRKYTDRRITIEGGIFEANGDYNDPTLSIQANRRAAIEIFGTPEVKIRNVTFRNLWGQAIELVSCPYWSVENCEFIGLVNLMCPGGSAGTGSAINITAINLSTGVVTLSDASSLSNNDDIYIDDITGTTELNGRVFRVTGKSGNNIKLLDYYADGSVTSAMDLSGFTTYVSGGTVSEADVNGLGYGIQVYAASCWGVAKNNRSLGCRHFITGDGIQDGTYSDAQWAEYGLPTNVTVEGNISLYSDGIPFDEHEECVSWLWKNNISRNASRGPNFQDSYYGVGFQSRGVNSTWIDNVADGGAWGMRISPSDFPIPCTITIKNFVAQNLLSKDSEGSYGIRIVAEVKDPTDFVKVVIDGFLACNMNTGIQLDKGCDVMMTATNLRFHGVDELLDIGAGTEVIVTDRLMADYRDTTFGSPHYFARMRSDATQGSSRLLLIGGATIIGESGHMPSEIFYESDTVTTKYYYLPSGSLIQYHGAAAAATTLMAGATTFVSQTGITHS